jgi:hypothetical protein
MLIDVQGVFMHLRSLATERPRRVRLLALLFLVLLPACEIVTTPRSAGRGRNAREAPERSSSSRRGGTSDDVRNAGIALEALTELARRDDPIPDDKVAELEAAGAALSDPKRASWIKFMVGEFRREAAWSQADADVAKAIAKGLGGEVTLAGTKTGAKQLSLPFHAKKGVCYTAFLRFQKAGRTEVMTGLKIDYPGTGSSPLQAYTVKSLTRPFKEWIVGACATDEVQATLKGALDSADAANGARYVVMATPKAGFPLQIATYMTVDEPDNCDTEAVYRLWADPVPGSLVYTDDGQPLLVTSQPDGEPPTAFNPFVHSLSAAGMGALPKKAHLTSKLAGKASFPQQFNWRGCPGLPRYSESVKLAVCNGRIDRQYDPQVIAFAHARDTAPNLAVARDAQAQRDRTLAQKNAVAAAACDPLDNMLMNKSKATFKRIVDLYTRSPRTSPIERAEALADQADLRAH